MKRLLFFTLLSSSALFAEECPLSPFSISGTSLRITDAHFKEDEIHDQTLNYCQNNIAFGYTQPFNELWGVIFGTGFVGTHVKWVENPEFEETQFGYVNFSIGAYTQAMPCWTWTLTVSAFVDTAVLDLSDYALYQGVIYGEYEITDTFFFDAGFILEGGLSHGKAWPIFGFSWEPECSRWSFHAIYPLDVSVEFDAIPDWLYVSAALRFFRDRHRLLETEPNPLGIYEYTSTGAELDLVFTPENWILLRGFIGSTFGGNLKVANRSNHNASHFKFNGSLYYGVSAIVTF